MKKIHDHSAGIDIGSRNIYIGIEGKEVAIFGTFTADFKDAVYYLRSNGVTTVAMEATGSYWTILYDVLTQAGLDVWLVDGRQTKQVPGRKTDVKDCQWINQLHSFGLLNRCFVAEGMVKELRSYHRLREDHIRSAAMHVNHMQKALIEMNIRLPEVLSQIQGASGKAMIEAILAGERDPHKLLVLCDVRIIKTKSEEILKALEGFYSESGLFKLEQAYSAYHFYQNQIDQCDSKIEEVLKRHQDPPKNESKKKSKPVRHHCPKVDRLEDHLIHIFGGRDATQLPGITSYTWFQIYSETGEDLSIWKSEKHFTSWLGLSPGQNNSGKKRSNKSKGKPKAGQIFRILAQSLIKSKKIALGEFGRRLRSRKGPGVAIKAVARKLAMMYWNLMIHGNEFVEQGVNKYQEQLLMQKRRYYERLTLELQSKSPNSKQSEYHIIVNGG